MGPRHRWKTGRSVSRNRRLALAVATVLLLGATTGISAAWAQTGVNAEDQGVAERANCGPGSSPELGIQGRVSLEDRQSGRSKQGYSCNMKMLGQYQGEGSTWVDPSYRHCAYMGTAFGGLGRKKSEGTQVVDVSDPQHPKLTANLTSPAMLTDSWESLKVSEERGLLAAVSGGPGVGALFFDVYDISHDCAHPRLLNSFNATNLTLPANVLGHEGGWSPDGLTYYAAGSASGSLSAIDVRNPAHPRVVYTGVAGFPLNHGFSLSPDGNRLYLTRYAPAGVDILDVSSIQRRDAVPIVKQVGAVTWTDGLIAQQTMPIVKDGKPYLLATSEFGAGGARFIDISDETHPEIAGRLRLDIQTSKHVDERRQDTTGNGLFGYENHYCAVNRRDEPTRLACGEFQSGVRVFDISDLQDPRELAYFNPPAQVGKNANLPGSEHASGVITATGLTASDVTHLNLGDLTQPTKSVIPNLTTDWCASPPRFVGSDQLWVSCQDNGFLALKFTNGVKG